MVVAIIYCILFNLFSNIVIPVSLGVTVSGFLSLCLMIHHMKNTLTLDIPHWKLILEIASLSFFGMGALLLATYLLLCKHVRKSLGIVRAVGIVISKNLRILILPFVSGMLTMIFLLLWLVVFGYLVSCGNIKLPKRGDRDDLDQG